MPIPRPRSGRARRAARTLAPLTAATLAIVPAGPALAQQQQTLSVNAASDSVLATGLPYGPTTVRVTRPDALTRAAVVIGQYADVAPGLLPFSVNTTTPTAFYPNGDCWQSGALALPGGLGLTPDIRPGDTVSVTGGMSMTVPAGDGSGAAGGPIPGCDVLSAYGRNRIAAATVGSGGDITVAGAAQPLTTGVSVTATDGRTTAGPVDATLAADGTWTAEIPADQVAKLAAGTVTVDGVYAVPDVSTGAPAHIAAAPLSVQKTTGPGDPGVNDTPPAPEPAPPTPPPAAPSPPPAGGPSAAPPTVTAGRLTAIRATTRISLARARRGGIRASFVVPAGTEIVRVRLSHAKRTTYLKLLAAGQPGTRQTVHLAGTRFARTLRRGRYVLTVSAGPSRAQLLGPAISATVSVH
jgi:hypothetical protein